MRAYVCVCMCMCASFFVVNLYNSYVRFPPTSFSLTDSPPSPRPFPFALRCFLFFFNAYFSICRFKIIFAPFFFLFETQYEECVYVCAVSTSLTQTFNTLIDILSIVFVNREEQASLQVKEEESWEQICSLCV